MVGILVVREIGVLIVSIMSAGHAPRQRRIEIDQPGCR